MELQMVEEVGRRLLARRRGMLVGPIEPASATLLCSQLLVLDAERMSALERVSQLDELAALVTAGVTDTTLTITTQPREEGR